jgi:hypothetical protein
VCVVPFYAEDITCQRQEEEATADYQRQPEEEFHRYIGR